MQNSRFRVEQRAWLVLAALFVFLVATYLLRPVSDNDFFWHIKTGEWIWEHGQLPTADPFSFAGPQQPTPRQLLILQGYPLAQLLYYGLHATIGWLGIYALRIVLLAGLFLVFFARVPAEARWSPLSFGLIFPCLVSILELYPLDRPQIFSFVFFGLLLLFCRQVRSTPVATPWSMPILATFALMLVWGNAHSGFILGQFVLIVYAGVEVLHAMLVNRQKDDKQKQLFFLIVVGLVGSLLNSTNFSMSIIEGILNPEAQKITAYNNEFFSTIEYFKETKSFIIVFVWIAMIVTFVVIAMSKIKENIAEIIILLVVSFYAFMNVRYLPFFMIAAVPFLLSTFYEKRIVCWVQYLVVAISVCYVGFYAKDEFGNANRLRNNGVIDERFPVKAVDFVVNLNHQGKIFNTYNWGGYLLWRLSPQQQVYLDGRALDEQVLIEALACEMNMPGDNGRRRWQEVMDRYGIDLAILPKYAKRGPHKLTQSMLTDPAWGVAYHDEKSAVFVRTGR